jgi:hypothetical protein
MKGAAAEAGGLVIILRTVVAFAGSSNWYFFGWFGADGSAIYFGIFFRL